MEYQGISGVIYQIEDECIAGGGEGSIYRIVNNDCQVAKIFKEEKRESQREKKLLFMMQTKLSEEQLKQITWPQDVIYDKNGFVGYIMPRLEKSESLSMIYSAGKYDLRQRLMVAYNLCAAVNTVHSAGQVCGDLNPQNICVNLDANDPNNRFKVTLVDTDSYHIVTPEVTFRCEVGLADYLAPEIQKKVTNGLNLKSVPLPTYTKETDLFAVSVHIFSLLMNGCHPFACAKETNIQESNIQQITVDSNRESVVAPQPIENIRDGFFPFYQTRAGITYPIYAPQFSALPKVLQKLFIRTFVNGYAAPSERVNTDEWMRALGSLVKNVTKCDMQHYYFDHVTECPFCKVNERIRRVMSGESFVAPKDRVDDEEKDIKETIKEESSLNGASPDEGSSSASPKKKMGVRRGIWKVALAVMFLGIAVYAVVCMQDNSEMAYVDNDVKDSSYNESFESTSVADTEVLETASVADTEALETASVADTEALETASVADLIEQDFPLFGAKLLVPADAECVDHRGWIQIYSSISMSLSVEQIERLSEDIDLSNLSLSKKPDDKLVEYFVEGCKLSDNGFQNFEIVNLGEYWFVKILDDFGYSYYAYESDMQYSIEVFDDSLSKEDIMLAEQIISNMKFYHAPVNITLVNANGDVLPFDKHESEALWLLYINKGESVDDSSGYIVLYTYAGYAEDEKIMLPPGHYSVMLQNDDDKTETYYSSFDVPDNGTGAEINVMIFLYDEYGFKSHPLSRFVGTAKEIGVTFVFFGNTRADIGLGCNYLIENKSGNKAQLIDTSDSRKTSEFVYNVISDKDLTAMVQLLAPVYTEEISLEGTLTKNISLFELLNIIAVDDINLGTRWNSSKVYQSMSAPIGVSKSGVITLDLHDKEHGPHGLVAGTTGAGKSEILQTYIMSMATLYHPYEVGFVIIDFKGGGMANQFKDLPHMMGTITNIDGKEINRSLKSIKAELKKRQRLFAEMEVNHIDKYIMKFRNGETAIPLPHLILIVDEFAELKAEQPDFMKELISAARIGRSLGVHLILATQKPSGQVDEQIWSNSRFKICLKVQSQQDSNEVLKSPLAAEIKEPGRAYLQVGNNEIFELFQSAYSGAPEYVDDSSTKEFTIYEISASGKRVPVYQQKKKKGNENDRTQLDSLVQYVKDYCDTSGLSKLPSICLPPLREMIDFPEEKFLHKNNNHIIADMGIYDDPDNQVQDMYTVDLSEQNMMIVGSAQSGKTNVLQTIIRSLTTKYSPEEVNIYIIDFASMYLKNFESLNHVGGVVTPSEDEKLKNLFKLLRMEVGERKEKLLAVGVSSYSAYRESGRTDLPQIILIIDNLTALRELYFQDDDELLNLCREGIALGITVVIANSQTSGIGYRYLSSFANRMALFNNDAAEYNSLFDHCSERIPNVQGRAIIDIEKVHLDAQIFLAYNGEREIQKVKQIRQFIQECNEKYKGSVAKRIPEIPEILTEEYIQEQFKQSSHNVEIMAGMDFASVAPCWFDLRKLGTLAVSGRDKMGRHNFIRYMIHMVQQWYADNCEVYLIDSISRRLSDLREFSVVRNYEVIAANAIEVVKSIEVELKKRYEAISAGNDDVLEHASLILLILNNKDIVEEISESSQALEAYNNITGKYKNMGVCVIVGDFENAKVSYMSPEIFKQLRDARKFLYFDDLDNMKIIDDLHITKGQNRKIKRCIISIFLQN